LLFWKIVKIVATRCQFLWQKCTTFDFGWGSAGPRWGSLQRSPRPLAGFNGPTSLPVCLLLTHVALCQRVLRGVIARTRYINVLTYTYLLTSVVL